MDFGAGAYDPLNPYNDSQAVVPAAAVPPPRGTVPPSIYIGADFDRFVHPQVKYLYSRRDRVEWSEYSNASKELADLDQRMTKFNIVHRKKQSSTYSWSTYSITIRGRPLETLAVVLDGYPGIDASKEELVLLAPYKPVLHRWEALKKYRDTVEDAERREDASLLISVFHGAMSASGEVLSKLYKSGTIAYNKLDLVFALGDIVVMKSAGVTSAHYLRSFDSMQEGSVWVALLECIDWNGSYFGFRDAVVSITEYHGEQPIESLPICPLKWCRDKRTLTDSLVARGRKFEALRGYHFKYYDGVGHGDLDAGAFAAGDRKPIRGRVVVDAHAFYECSGVGKPAWSTLDRPGPMFAQPPQYPHTGRPGKRPTGRKGLFDQGTPASSAYAAVDYGHHASIFKPQDVKVTRNIVDQPPLTDEQCMVTHTHVKGMAIDARQWFVFSIDDLTDIDWRPEIFQRLVLPDGIKEMTLAAVRHKQAADVDVDVVPGKGRGMLLLTFGPPGTGKTMTAEAVGEECRVPLYAMSAGDLSTHPAEVEKALDRAFHCCALWNAVMLLDEADVFLAKRTIEGLERNELVSIFLRKLEHYQGVLFLTTNRMDSIDAAFQSRIDLMLPFDPLTEPARAEVWRNFVETNGGSDRFGIAPDDLAQLAAMNLNGREIKNLVKTALVLNVADNKEDAEGEGEGTNGEKGKGKVAGDTLLKLAKMRIRAQQLLKDQAMAR
ncbi:hypothetical protein PG993_000067 [Apiospora rasikravindrae]|uniref:AAA+ ATPase domain-containing protein n=1 Tax=Apiospora rasikravindrae TaxID=990691 RepID=A0ABR1U7F3_9PEZI